MTLQKEIQDMNNKSSIPSYKYGIPKEIQESEEYIYAKNNCLNFRQITPEERERLRIQVYDYLL